MNGFVFVALCGGVISIAANVGVLQAQEPPACRGCEVFVWQTGLLTGGKQGLEGDPEAAVLAADHRLYFVLSKRARPLFAADLAKDVITAVGTVGAGPGEMQFARRLHRSWNDSLFVYDLMQRRMSVFDPTGAFVRSVLFIGDVNDFVQLKNGSFLVSANLATRESAGLPLHLVDSNGNLIRSFGSDAPVAWTTGDEAYKLQRSVALSADGTVLAVRTGSYVIERWSPEGTLLGTWDVAPDWFTPKDRTGRPTPNDPKPPMVRGIQEDAQGRVWTIVLREDVNWKRAVRPPDREPATYSITSTDEFHDSQVEVFDGKTMTRLATKRVDPALAWFVGPGVAATRGSRLNDEPIVRLLRLSLQRRP